MSISIALTCLCLGWADPPAAVPPASAFEIVASIETVMEDAIVKAEPSVVAIGREKDENAPKNQTQAVRGRMRREPGNPGIRFGLDVTREYFSSDYGSGVVIGDRGEILTAFHVVRGATTLLVRASEGQQFTAEVIAADPRSDLAVIAPIVAPGVPVPRLKPLKIGDASQLRKGSFLIALGNPFNAARDGRPSASWGILSNVNRKVEGPEDGFGNVRKDNLHHYPTLLQLDSKLNLGMSGGAVINMKGELVGVTTTASSPAGFDVQAGYALPMDRIGKRIVETLIQGKEVEYGLLGIVMPRDGTNRVSDVRPGSPAAEGQLQINDEIVAVNDTPIANFEGLILAVHAFAPGDPVRLKVVRDGKPLERTVVLAKFPVEGEIIATNRHAPWRGIRVDYSSTMSFRIPDPTLLSLMTRGVVVADVEEGSPAAAAGLKKGQIIRKVGDQAVGTPSQFEAAVAKQAGPTSLTTDQGEIVIKEGR